MRICLTQSYCFRLLPPAKEAATAVLCCEDNECMESKMAESKGRVISNIAKHCASAGPGSPGSHLWVESQHAYCI